jgi:NAD(P)H-hydrate repair Nnr-like enzyme with NAD(P)H-hydrate dehydratase domain
LTAEPGGRAAVNSTGNPGQATGGMGDILAGLLGGLLAQGLGSFEAAAAGVWLHGRAGDLAALSVGPRGFTASETADLLPAAIRGLREREGDVDRV